MHNSVDNRDDGKMCFLSGLNTVVEPEIIEAKPLFQKPRTEEPQIRSCMCCGKDFNSSGKFNRLCCECKR